MPGDRIENDLLGRHDSVQHTCVRINMSLGKGKDGAISMKGNRR